MGTYAQPGITQGQALMAEKADYASGLSKTFKAARLSKDNQMAMIETSKNALAKQTAELMQEANKIESNDNSELADSFKQTIIDQIDALDLLEYNSIGRDQTEVTKMRSNLLNGVEGATGNFMKLLAEAEDYNKRVVNGTSPKTVSNTNSNPEAIPFLNALGVNGGRKVKTDWDGLGFNLSYEDPTTGKEFKINPTNYYAGREQGLSGLWNEVQDPSPTFKASFDQLAKKYPNISMITERKGANGELITTTSLDSEKAYDNIRNGILNDKLLKNGIDGDVMQFLAGSGFGEKLVGAAYDPEDTNQEKDIMEATADYMMSQYSKGNGTQISKINTKVGKGGGDDDVQTTKLNHTDFINNLSADAPMRPSSISKAEKGKVYRDKDGTLYRFDGKNEYIPVEGNAAVSRDEKLAEIRKYLLKAKKGKDVDIKPGNHPEVKIAMEGDETYNPDILYRKEGKVGGNTSTITYTPIDLELSFTDDLLNDLEAMENQLNTELGINPI